MLSQPFQNAETLHRAEVVSDHRSADIIKLNAVQQEAQAAMRKSERLRVEAVEAVTEITLDPNAEHEHERQNPNHKKRSESPSTPENTDKSIKPHILGPGHVDITV